LARCCKFQGSTARAAGDQIAFHIATHLDEKDGGVFEIIRIVSRCLRVSTERIVSMRVFIRSQTCVSWTRDRAAWTVRSGKTDVSVCQPAIRMGNDLMHAIKPQLLDQFKTARCAGS